MSKADQASTARTPGGLLPVRQPQRRSEGLRGQWATRDILLC